MSSNRHNQSIPEHVLHDVQMKIRESLEILKPYVVSLTPEERHQLPKMGAKTLNFVEKAASVCRTKPDALPAVFQYIRFQC
jgi:hypothetical protein